MPWLPISSEWIRTVDKEGKVNLAVGISLTLIKAMSSGIRNPFSWIARKTPIAIESEAINHAFG